MSATSTTVVGLGVACWLLTLSGWHSPLRVVLVLAFLAFGPGLVIGEILEVRDLPLRVSIAWAASFAVETIVALALVYSGAFSAGLTLTIVLVITAALAIGRAQLPDAGEARGSA
jgi:hypothetical protein